MSKTQSLIFKKFKAEFGVTYFLGEPAANYLFLNKTKEDPKNIDQLNQYYDLEDSSINLSTSVGVYYYETDELEIRFSSVSDSLTLRAINRIYSKEGRAKIKNLIREKRLKNPFVIINVDKKLKSFFVLLKDKNHPHNYLI